MFWKRKKNPPAHQHGPDGHGDSSATPDEDLAIARQALDAGDLGHALQHVAWALASDSESPIARALLDRIIAAARDPLQLVSLDKPEVHYSIVAVRAFILARRHQMDEALQLMNQIYHALPGLPYFPWLLEWLGDAENAATINPRTMTAFLVELSHKMEQQFSTADHAHLEALLPLLSRYHEAHPEAATFACLASRMFRQFDRMDEALVLARAGHEREPTYFSAVILGTTHKARGELVEAATMFDVARRLNPDEPAVLLDLGDILCDLGEFDSGLAEYQQALDREPEHPWAKPSYLYFKHFVDPPGSWRAQLAAYAANHPNNARARDLNMASRRYIAFLPEPDDATTQMLKAMVKENQGGAKLTMGLSSLESPSARLAIELYQIEQTGHAQLVVAVADIQQPDPRVPHGPVEYVLWRYQGTDPEPAIGPPASQVQSVVAALASRSYDLDGWSREAGRIALQLGPARLNDLLGVMVHPPRRPAEIPIWVWLYRVQVASALIIGHLGGDPDGGWDGSLRKRVLFSLARGPMDWTVGAAIVALAQVARQEPATVPEIAALYGELLDSLPEPGSIAQLDALLTCALLLPSPPPELLERVKRHYYELVLAHDGGPPPPELVDKARNTLTEP
jgi:tetratricopeptide (TPR) repeat protein